jgi:hypothetical protein
MKNIRQIALIAAVFQLVVMVAYAQKQKHSFHQPAAARKNTTSQPHWKQHLARLTRRAGNVTAKHSKRAERTMTPIAERLVGASNYDFFYPDTIGGGHLGVVDSSAFQYGGARSSTFNYTEMFFDPLFYFNGTYMVGEGTNMGYRARCNRPAIMFDSCLSFIFGTSIFTGIDTCVLTDVQYAVYDSDYNTIEWADLRLSDTATAVDENRYVNTYDRSDNMITSMALSWDYGLWDTSEIREFAYTPAPGDNVIADSSSFYSGAGVWELNSKWVYSYDDSSNLIHADYYFDSLGTWLLQEQYFMRYDSLNRLTWDSVAVNDYGTWEGDASDSLGYTPGLDFVTYECSISYTAGIAGSYLYRLKHITPAGLPDSLYEWEINASDSTYLLNTKLGFTYDSYNEPTTCFEYLFFEDSTLRGGIFDSIADYKTFYYYETYTMETPHHHTGVVTPPPTEKIKVYPNPANNEIHISRPDAVKGSYALIKLVNAVGQTVRTESLLWMREPETVSIAGLAPGAYWLVVINSAGNIVGREEVVKE